MSTPAPAQHAVIYARYSSHSQRDVSIDQQIKEIRKYAEKLNINILDIYADHATTGTNDRRPEFQRMIKDAEKGAFSYVIVYTLDRFARDRYDSAVYKRQLKNCGVKVLSAMENINDDPTGILMESMLEGLAEYYSKELSRKIIRGNMDNAEKCMVNGKPPFGFRRGDDGKYAIVPEEAEIVKEIYTRFAAGETFSDIATDLNNRGIRTKTGSAWGKNSFDRLISNERYIGTYIYKDIRIEGGIPPILEKELFDKVQYLLVNKKNPKNAPVKRRRDNSVYLLTGKLYCGKCKEPMIGIAGTSRNKELHHYYKCSTKNKTKTCDKENVRRDWAEYQVAAALKNYVLNDEAISWLADKAVEYFEANKEFSTMKLLKSQLADVQRSLKNVMSAIEQGIITNSTKARLTELEAEEAELKAKISISEEKSTLNISREDIVIWLSTFKDGDISDKNFQEMLFDAFLVSAYLYDDHWKIIFNAGKTQEVSVPLDIDAPPSDDSVLVRIRDANVHQSSAMRTIASIHIVEGLFVLTCDFIEKASDS